MAKIPIIEEYELVFWPDTCAQVPTYNQLQMSLELVAMYQSDKESFSTGNAKLIEKWLSEGNLMKFIVAANKAEAELEKLSIIRDEWLEDQINFPMNKKRTDN